MKKAIQKPEENSFSAKNRKEWRKWLSRNFDKKENVWLVIYHKESKTPSIYYPEAVEEALCFGWIDSRPNKRNDESYYLFFSPRKPKSKWSRINKVRVVRLTEQGLMTAAGQAKIDLAKRTGTWDALNDSDALKIPEDFQKKLNKNKTADKNFNAFPPSSKKIILEWIANAKRTETRNKRIEEAVALAGKNIRANHYKN